MSLRVRFAIFAILAIIFYSVGLIVSIDLLTGQEFQRIEEQLAQTDLQRVSEAFNREKSTLEDITRSFSQWTNSWSFIQTRQSGFPAIDFSPERIRNLKIDLAVITGNSGSIIHTHIADAPLNGQADTVPLGIPRSDGILEYGGWHYLVVSLPITKNDGSGGSKARMMLGRRIDQDFLGRLAQLAQVPVDLEMMDAREGFTERLNQLDGLPQAIMPLPDGRTLQGLMVLKDVFGKDHLILGTMTKRALSAQLPRFYGLVALISLVAVSLLTGLIWLSFSRMVTYPLTRLAKTLKAMDFETMAPGDLEPGNALGQPRNEVGTILKVFMELRSRLIASRTALMNANDNLESLVAERTAALTEANHELTRYARILTETSEGVVVTDLGGRILEVNDALVRMSGFSREELIGANPRAMKSDRHGADFYQVMWRDILQKGRWSGEIWDRRKNGEVYAKWLSVTTLSDDQGRPIQYVGLSSDITRIKEAESRLNQLAYYDSLTGLPNRSLFLDRLALALARAQRGGYRVALLYMDLDRFKLVNDTHGHTAGDNLLIQVGQRLSQIIRDSDTICRLGGDEFTVILENISRSEDVGEVCRKICERLAEPFQLQDQEVFTACSIGVALFPFDGLTSSELIQKADETMYKAKEAGRAQWRFASGQINQESRRRMEVESGLRYAIARDEFLLYYQPQFTAADKALIGAEALIRWKRDGKILAPGEFIDIAEESDLICQMGAWALRIACLEAKSLAEAGHPLVISVNLSARQFSSGDLPALVAATLRETGLEPHLLKLEVTESLFMKNIAPVVATMQQIRESGVAFAVDDFGVGFSSLRYLSQLPLDCLKIDKSFVDGLDKSDGHSEIVAAVISLAKTFHLTAIAEGVETPAQLKRLREMGCDQIQGYLTGRPMPAGDFHQLALATPSPAAAAKPKRPRKASKRNDP